MSATLGVSLLSWKPITLRIAHKYFLFNQPFLGFISVEVTPALRLIFSFYFEIIVQRVANPCFMSGATPIARKMD